MDESARIVEMGQLEARRYDTVFVSPHLDDVALSCPGALYAHRQKGERVLVAVVFSHVGAAGSTARRVYETRRAEERCAATRGGYDLLWGQWTDAPFRDPPHRDFNAIVWDDGPDDDAIVEALTRWLSDIVSRTRPKQVVGPLGVGRHIDHRLAYRALRHIDDRDSVTLWHYEDRPYALVDQAVQLRLGELGRSVDVQFRPFWDSFSRATYVRNHLCGQARTRCRTRYAELCVRHMGRKKRSTEWSSRLIAVDDCDSIWNVVAAHTSQIEAFVGDLKTFRSQCLEYARRIEPEAGYLERQWSKK